MVPYLAPRHVGRETLINDVPAQHIRKRGMGHTKARIETRIEHARG
jgi:hypothetical protein